MKYWTVAFFDCNNECVGETNSYNSPEEANKELAWLKKFGYPNFQELDVRIVPTITPEIKSQFISPRSEEEEMKVLKRYEMGWDNSRKVYKVCWACTLAEALETYKKDAFDYEYPPLDEIEFDNEEDMYGYFEARANAVGVDF